VQPWITTLQHAITSLAWMIIIAIETIAVLHNTNREVDNTLGMTAVLQDTAMATPKMINHPN